MSQDMTQGSPSFTWLSPRELLELIAEVEAAYTQGRDARAELHQRLAEVQERRRQRWAEEWLMDEQTRGAL